MARKNYENYSIGQRQAYANGWADGLQELREELKVLRAANSKVVIENSRLHDEILVLTHVDRASIQRCERVDRGLARQLGESIELNARAKNRLQTLASKLEKEADPAMRDVADDLKEVLKDRDLF